METPDPHSNRHASHEAESVLEFQDESDSIFAEAEELELASELLGARSEPEFDRFLDRVLRCSIRAIRRGLSRTLARTLGGILKGVIRRVIPHAGRPLHLVTGNAAPGQPRTRSLLASGGGLFLGLDLEGLSAEDREFEAGRQLVRLAGAAVANAATAASTQPSAETARQAVVAAARIYAPGLLRRPPTSPPSSHDCSCHARSGSWERSGNEIILHGL